jgi:hypothetical protein
MALDNLQVDYLIDPAFQIENLAGKPAVGGHVEVFEARHRHKGNHISRL